MKGTPGAKAPEGACPRTARWSANGTSHTLPSNDAIGSVVYITSLLTPATAGAPATYEQGSGVLVAPDEVLTAAHVVEDASGNPLTGTEVSPGYQGAVLHGVAGAAGIHVGASADRTTLSGGQSDFALVHLSTPLAGMPTMALGADFAGGAVTVTGYPAATSGDQDSVAETVSKVAGYDLLQGAPLGAPGDPHGASGGPAWETVGGVATVVGLTQSEAGGTGYFVGLTSADVDLIDAWMAQDHASAAAAPSGQATAAGATVAAAVALAGIPVATAGPATGDAADAISALSADAPAVPLVAAHGYLDRAVSRMVSVLQADADAMGRESSFGDVLSGALAGAGDNSLHRNLGAALLEGVTLGYGGGDAASVIPSVSAVDPGILAHHGSMQAARAGFALGRDLAASGM